MNQMSKLKVQIKPKIYLGISYLLPKLSDFINNTLWIPAFAGMTT
jgi:hypothetical protein